MSCATTGIISCACLEWFFGTLFQVGDLGLAPAHDREIQAGRSGDSGPVLTECPLNMFTHEG